jgi:ABC-type amino acid transport substrate-binding protein
MIRRAAALLICAVLAALCLLPACALTEENHQKVVRVGWYETPFNHKDTFGRRTGYAYEYQRKIAAYTGWKYQYVEGNWPELMQMLRDGRIDLMSDVSYLEERAEYMLYSSLPMGEELYYLYVDPGNKEISADDYRTLNGKKVGITRGTVQIGLFDKWLKDRGLSVELVELDTPEAESIALLHTGAMDAFITLDTYGDPESAVALWKIGSSNFFFAVSKKRPDLLPELDAAMNRIQDENKHYNEQLSNKYLKNTGTNLYLSLEEREWLEAHGVNPSRLIVEDHSLTTAQNAIYTFNILSERYPQVKQIALISSDYHIATGTLLFGAEAILRGSAIEVVSNASWHAPGGTLSAMFQAGALIELSGDVETAFEIYYETYDIHELPPLHQETAAES